jgi:hypothetical protein
MFYVIMSLRHDPQCFWYMRGYDGRPLLFDNYGYAHRHAYESKINDPFYYSEDEELIYSVVEKEGYLEL